MTCLHLALRTTAVAATLALMAAAPATAATFQVLHQFTATDGQQPVGGVAVDAAGIVYGTTMGGGQFNRGTLFKLSGGTLSTLHDFSDGNPYNGSMPAGSLLRGADGTLYGTSYFGGVGNLGTAFKYDDRVGFQLVHSFAGGAEGAYPEGGLAIGADGSLYGSATQGGDFTCSSSGCGTLFSIAPTTFKVKAIHAFHGTDGANPYATPTVASSGLVYGTSAGNSNGSSTTVFSTRTSGKAFTNIAPDAGTVFLSGVAQDAKGYLWGVAAKGGDFNRGGIYRVDPKWQSYTLVYSFGPADGSYPSGTPVVDSHGVLYGTTQAGGAAGQGTVYRLDTTNWTFTTLHAFAGNEGTSPIAGLSLGPAGVLYGVAAYGGNGGNGTIFSVTP